jgi:hypothetical protein
MRRDSVLRLILESWVLLVYCDWLMRFGTFEELHTAVAHQAVEAPQSRQVSHPLLCHAMDLACVFYFKRVLCLQRSAATVMQLRRYGWASTFVIGAQLLPFQSHAWVELENRVVNDKPYISEMFQVLERC